MSDETKMFRETDVITLAHEALDRAIRESAGNPMTAAAHLRVCSEALEVYIKMVNVAAMTAMTNHHLNKP